jgi:hypothetical protein
MTSDYQQQKKQERMDRINAQRENRKVPITERQRPLGLGTNRSRLNAQQKPPAENMDVKSTAPANMLKPPIQKPPVDTKAMEEYRRDKIEISTEAYQKYKETVLVL